MSILFAPFGSNEAARHADDHRQQRLIQFPQQAIFAQVVVGMISGAIMARAAGIELDASATLIELLNARERERMWSVDKREHRIP